jgi:hypothetical protein
VKLTNTTRVTICFSVLGIPLDGSSNDMLKVPISNFISEVDYPDNFPWLSSVYQSNTGIVPLPQFIIQSHYYSTLAIEKSLNHFTVRVNLMDTSFSTFMKKLNFGNILYHSNQKALLLISCLKI